MFSQKYNKELISNAWEDFADRLRWRLRFELSETTEYVDYEFDPDYYLPKSSRKTAAKMGAIIEYGLLCGERFVNKTLSEMPSEVTEDPIRKSLAPPIRRIRNYLADNKIILTVTDKNLGVAACSADWIRIQSQVIISNPSDYQILSQFNADKYLMDKANLMYDIAEYCDNVSDDVNLKGIRQLPDFFWSRCPDRYRIEDGWAYEFESLRKNVSRFYVIPKIHKNPVKGRPIVPCHSVIQGPAGKFVSKQLKPIIRKSPFIIHGSKDLAIKLSKLDLPRRKLVDGKIHTLYIVSGDVVAFYPHVDVQKAHSIALEEYRKYLREDTNVPPIDQAHLSRLLTLCMTAADADLIMQFNGVFYRQVKGLAMGVASSPDLANLYGHYFEERFELINDKSRVPFYGRYIDDCLALVYAPSENDALALMQSLRYDNCTIEWSSSSSHMTFLDMLLYFDAEDRLQHKPFRKPMNHFERIPYVSNHPLYVKRGTFLGELSRMATLSSTMSNYLDACKDVACIYIARGYPPQLIKSWFKENYQKRWDDRICEEKVARPPVLVLKSEFNPAWDYMNAQLLGEHIRHGWLQALHAYSQTDTDFPKDFRWPETSLVPPLPSSWLLLGGAALKGVHSSWFGLGVAGQYIRLDKSDVFSRQVLVSKKRTRQLSDLASTWKKHVLELTDETILDPGMEGKWTNTYEPPPMEVSELEYHGLT